MTRNVIRSGWLIAAVALLAAAVVRGAQAEEVSRPVTIEGAVEIPFVSEASGEAFRLLLWRPDGPAPKGGYPVLYSFDGEDSFALLTGIARMLNPAAARVGVAPVAVAAIAYPPGRASLDRRVFDLTPPAASATGSHRMPERPNGKPWPKLGGGDAFLDMLESEVKPRVRSALGVETAAQTLFGHSLGGLMVLRRLVTDPTAFDCYAASSPSLWVDDRRMLADMAAFLASSPKDGRRPRLQVSVGSAEEDLGPFDPVQGKELEARRRWIANNAMVTNARSLARVAEAGKGRAVAFAYREYEARAHQPAKVDAALDAIGLALECAGR